MKFYDRVNEMQILQENDVQAERSAVFTVLMGRRRVGKTSLITHAMEGREYAYLFISMDNEAYCAESCRGAWKNSWESTSMAILRISETFSR